MNALKSGLVLMTIAVHLAPGFALAATQEELLEKIKLLEIQIQQLKELKAQRNRMQEKEQQCVKAVGTGKFCKCLADALPDEMGFEQYVHEMVTGADQDSRAGEGQRDPKSARTAHDTCVQKGLFW